MVNPNYDKWAKSDGNIKAWLGDSIFFQPKYKAPDSIPYHNEVELYSFHTQNDNDHITDNGIPLYEKPITNYWFIEVCLPQG